MKLQKSFNCVLAILLLGIFLKFGDAQVPSVTIIQGTLQGKTLVTNYNKSISGFLGVPYAQPPTGDLRFSAPVAANVWNTTFNASIDSSMCPQDSGSEIVGEEDCLYLNVYTPQLPENGNSTLIPVMVYIHGGGFLTGSANSMMHGPEYLLDHDVVLIVPNYRLGPFGFLSTGDEVAPGNWGLKDMVLALEWVQNNIAYFGGDPDQVTLFGQDAGAGAVHLLTLSNSTIGLFHRYITQSGSALQASSHQPRTACADRTRQLGEYLDCRSNTSALLIACLRALNTSEIMNTSSNFTTWEGFSDMTWGPTDEPDIEGAVLIDTPANIIASGQARDLPWMVGVNRDEGILISAAFAESSDLFQRLLNNFDKVIPYILQTTYQYDNLTAYTEALKSYYFNDLTANSSILLTNFTNLLSDSLFFYPAYNGLQQQLAVANNSQYFYTFEYRGTYSYTGGSTTNYGVSHCDELLYLFPESETLFGTGKVLSGTDSEMVDILVKLWTSFAINGTPTATVSNSTITWEPYSSLNNHLRIGNESDVVVDMEYSLHDERMKFWTGLLTELATNTQTTTEIITTEIITTEIITTEQPATEQIPSTSTAVPLLSNLFPILTVVVYFRISL